MGHYGKNVLVGFSLINPYSKEKVTFKLNDNFEFVDSSLKDNSKRKCVAPSQPDINVEPFVVPPLIDTLDTLKCPDNIDIFQFPDNVDAIMLTDFNGFEFDEQIGQGIDSIVAEQTNFDSYDF